MSKLHAVLAVAAPLVLTAGSASAQTTTIVAEGSLVTITDTLGPASITRKFRLGNPGVLVSDPFAYRILATDPLRHLPLAGQGVSLPAVGLPLFAVTPFDGSLILGRAGVRPGVLAGSGAARLGDVGWFADILVDVPEALVSDLEDALALDRLATAASYRIEPRSSSLAATFIELPPE